MTLSSGRTRTRLSPEQRRFQLLNSAMEAFSKRGIGRAGHADIAELAQVSVATVFNYFPTREMLVHVVLAEAASAYQDLITQNIKQPRHAKATLTNICFTLVDEALADKDWLKIWFEWSTSIREDIWPVFITTKNNVIDQITECLASGIASGEITSCHDAATLARLFDGICYILFLQAHQQPDKDALTQQITDYMNMLCDNPSNNA